MGFLYVDGHVRVYHGKHLLPKTHVARMRIAMPATTDYWVNDAEGEPLFVVTAEANAGLVKMLPVVLEEVRGLVGERRVTVVFDRGGWSPASSSGSLMTASTCSPIARDASRAWPGGVSATEAVFDGREIATASPTRACGCSTARCACVRSPACPRTRHQTPIITSRRDLAAVEVAYRMFERWRQENFFKYLREEYALDALVDYGTEPPTRPATSPTLRARPSTPSCARHAPRSHSARSTAARRLPTPRACGAPCAASRSPTASSARCSRRRTKDRVWRNGGPPCPCACRRGSGRGRGRQASPERKHLANILKMVAYQAESDLVRLVPPYPRAEDEGRTLIHAALQANGDLEVGDDQLAIALAPLSAPHRTRALAAVCAQLNATAARFPGSRLRLVYAVRGPP